MEEDKTEDQKQESEEAEESAAAAATEEAEDKAEETKDEETEESEDSEESEAEETEEQSEEESEEDEPEPSPRQNKAIERLTKKLAEASKQNRQPELTQKEKQMIDEGDYTTEELNEKFSKYGDQRYSEALMQAQQSLGFQTRLEIDAPKVAQKYEILNRNSEKYDPGQTALVGELYLRTVGYDENSGLVQRPDVRYEEFVDGIMEMVEIASAARNANSQRNVAKAAARTGVRPSGEAKKSYSGSDPRKMSDAQLTSTINDMLGIKPK
jgi:hypothetical protein